MTRPIQTAEEVAAAPDPAALMAVLRLAARGLAARVAVVWHAEGGVDAASAPAGAQVAAFCAAALARGGAWLLSDAADQPDFAMLPLRFRVAVPLRGAAGQAIGVLAVLDAPPRAGLTTDQRAVLEDCAAAAAGLLRMIPATPGPGEAAFPDLFQDHLFQDHPAPMWIYDKATLAFLEVNEAAVVAYGWQRAEFLRMTLLDIRPEADRARVTDAAQGDVAGLLVTGPWTHRTATGAERQVQILSRLVTFRGRPAALVVVWDVTERLALEGQLRQAQRLEAIGQLTGGVAHDFNNLLTVILGNAELLAEGLQADGLKADPGMVEMARTTMAAAERGAALTGRLLAFSRRQALDPKVVDLRPLLAELLQMLGRTLGEHVATELLHAEGLWPALIDASQLENAVLNLCINARDAMPAGGRLVIETANVTLDAAYARREQELAPGDYVMVAVSDTGTGMTPEVAAHAVEPFFTTKDVGQGSGLGLSMVFGFIKQSGGHLKIYSEPGHGTTVKLYLPRAHGPARRDTATSEPALPRGSGETLLVVEDDRLVRDHVAAQLRDLGYRVVLAADAAAALQALGQPGPIDLLFTDVVMPGGLHGPALAEAARRMRPGLRVLFTSGYTENGIIHHGRLDPGVLLLSKPYRRRDLAQKVRLALKRPDPG